MTEIPDALVDKAAERLDTINPECVTTAEDCAREALVAVLPDVRRAVAEEIAAALDARARTLNGVGREVSAYDWTMAAKRAREVGGSDA